VGAAYNLTGYTAGTLTIDPAALLITADDASRIEGEPNPVFTATYTGFKNGEDASVLSGLTLTSPATLASVPGAYAITPAGATAANYTMTYQDGTLTVTVTLGGTGGHTGGHTGDRPPVLPPDPGTGPSPVLPPVTEPTERPGIPAPETSFDSLLFDITRIQRSAEMMPLSVKLPTEQECDSASADASCDAVLLSR